MCFFALGEDMGNLLKANKVKLLFFQVGLRGRERLIRQKNSKKEYFFSLNKRKAPYFLCG